MFFTCVFQKKAVPLHRFSEEYADSDESRGGGIGRHAGLKILWTVMSVPVRPRPAVRKKVGDEPTFLFYQFPVFFTP